jgi:hypothetical protein
VLVRALNESSRPTIVRSAASRRGHRGMKRSGRCQMTLMITMRGADKKRLVSDLVLALIAALRRASTPFEAQTLPILHNLDGI